MLDNNDPDPFRLFESWLNEAKACESLSEPTAMTLSTVDAAGYPSSRVVLLREWTPAALTFYTNFASRKGEELKLNPWAALCFYWMPLGKQIRVRGSVTAVPDEQADAYFAKRPRGSQIGAWASLQSQTLHDRDTLEQRVTEVTAEFEGKDIPRPAHWSGFSVHPDSIEFWQHAEFRLHHRRAFIRNDDGTWTSDLLYP